MAESATTSLPPKSYIQGLMKCYPVPPVPLHASAVKCFLMLCTPLVRSAYHFLLCMVGICVCVSSAEFDLKLLTHGGCSINRY